MKANVGSIDRTIRIILGLVIAAIGIFVVKSTAWIIILTAFGLILFSTGLTRMCLMYMPFKINTCKTEEKPAA